MTRPPSEPATSGRRSPRERRRRDRRALAAGLAVSLVVHVVVIGLLGDWLEPEAAPEPRTAPVRVEPVPGMRVVEIQEMPSAPEPAAEPVPQEETADPTEPREEPAPMAAVELADSVPADDRSAADRLAVRLTDPRLWEPMVLIPREPTIEDVEARVGAAVELLSDSALAEADAAIRARDWTVDDGSGGKWGISPGKIHLGKVTLPLPIWFPQDPEAVAAEQQWYELERALDRARLLESFEDRVQAVRERREQERRKKGDNGGG